MSLLRNIRRLWIQKRCLNANIQTNGQQDNNTRWLKLMTLQKDCAYLHCLSGFFCQLLALICLLLDDALCSFFFLLISGIAIRRKLSWLVPSDHLITEIFEKSFGCCWDWTQVPCIISSAGDRFIHYAMASQATLLKCKKSGQHCSSD